MTINKKQGSLALMILAFFAFIALGMPDGLWGVAAPFVRHDFSVGYDVMWMASVAFVISYSTSGFFSSRIMAKMGVGGMLAASTGLTGLTLWANTLVPGWGWWVAIGLFAGLGAGAIDSGLNTYVASHYGEHTMQWLHACYGIGVTLGPLIMTAAITYSKWRLGYKIVSVAQILLALAFVFTIKMWMDEAAPSEEGEKKLTEYDTPISETLKHSASWFSGLLFFFYVGVEVSFGMWTYSILYESRHLDASLAGLWSTSYWAMFTLGRIFAGFLAQRIGAKGLLNGGLAAALLGSLLLWWNPFPVSGVIAVSMVGFAIAPLFPSLMSLTAERVGAKHAANTIGMQIAFAGIGGALLPGLAGILAAKLSLEVIPLMMVAEFAALIVFFIASKPKPEPKAV